MKILLVHNRYQQYGGEDATFQSEKTLLEANGHEVSTLIFDNNEIKSLKGKIKVVYQLFYNKDSEELVTKAISDIKPDIMHVHNFFYVASPSIFFSAHKHKVPVVVTLHNYRLICAGGFLMRDSQPCELCIDKNFPSHGTRYGCHRNSRLQSAHLTLATGTHKVLDTWNKKVTRYIALTEFGRNKYINSSLKLSPYKIVVKANSVEGSEESPFERREKYFLFIGRLSKEKGIEVLLEAFRNTSSALEIIGDGPLRSIVEAAAREKPNIQYSGYREKNYIISRLSKCRALIFPSVWYEGLPTTILEAFSTGTPVIISDLGNLNEIVSDGYNGLHFKTNSASDLLNLLEDFNSDVTAKKSLYLNARKTYLQRYTHEINYRNLMRIYAEAIND